MRWYVPSGYTVQEAGFVRSYESYYASHPEELVMGLENVKKHISGMTDSAGIYTMNINMTNLDRVMYVRAFLTFTDGQGNVITIYSDMSQGSYNQLAGN